MRSKFQILLAALLVLTGASLRADEQQDLIATLQSTAGAPQKWAACQRLRVIGTEKAVPALAALLTDEHLSQAARHALDGLPYREVGTALRDALGKTSGLLKVGVIDSLGWCGEQQSVPVLVPLLTDADANIATVTAAALGRIGGKEALAALSAARAHATGMTQTAILQALLACADHFATANDNAGALAVYQELSEANYPLPIRTAAWRGLALSDPIHRPERILKALQGTDRPVQLVALKFLRESPDVAVVRTCVAHWSSLAPESQLAVLDARVKLGGEAVTLVRQASQSPDLTLRVAAWQAFGELNDTTSVPALTRAAAQGEPQERQAARETLERLHGPGVEQALIAQIASGSAAEKAELLRVLGKRGDQSAAQILLDNAASDVEPVRVAALAALGTLAPPDAGPALLEMAARAQSDAERGPVVAALYAVCESSKDPNAISAKLVPMLSSLPLAQRLPLLPLLAELGTPEALAAAQADSRDSNPGLAREALRVLAQWPSAAPATSLLELARSSTDSTLQILALRGAIQVAGQEPDLTKRLALLQEANASARRVEEKRLVLGELGQVPAPEALELALQDLPEPDLTDEAALAALSIAEKLGPSHKDLAEQTAEKVLARIQEGDIARRAWALRRKPATNAPFIRNWLVSGPYRRAGVVGAKAVFKIAFAPEKRGARRQWTALPPADHINLATTFPGQENCAAYLLTRVIAPEDCRALLLLGSDDGVQAWLNGKVVHSNNVDRGEIADQDTAPIHLRKGANDLMLKISQGGGGWSACARIVGTDFKPISGLEEQCPQPGMLPER